MLFEPTGPEGGPVQTPPAQLPGELFPKGLSPVSKLLLLREVEKLSGLRERAIAIWRASGPKLVRLAFRLRLLLLVEGRLFRGLLLLLRAGFFVVFFLVVLPELRPPVGESDMSTHLASLGWLVLLA